MLRGIDGQLAGFRRLVVVRNTGERSPRPGAGLGVMTLWIAALANFCWRCDIDLAEHGIGNTARRATIVPRRRHRGDDRNVPVTREMSSDFGQAADVLAAIACGKTEIAVEPGAQRVAVQQYRR